MIDLSIVIVSWNVRDLLHRCLSSVRDAVSASDKAAGPAPACTRARPLVGEIIVVDNSSTDGTVEMVRGEFPAVNVIVNSSNRGFPSANNQGLAVARGRFVLLLNPDTEVVGDALTRMVAFADAHPDAGVIGPQLLNSDRSVQPSRYRFPTLATAFFESTWLQPCAPRRVIDRYYVRDVPDSVTQDVDWLRGAALLARREAIAMVGPLDEGFFMYSEELDWCHRFRDAGWRVVYLSAARVVHYEGKSSEQAIASRHIHFQTSKVRYFRKYHGAAAAQALRWFLLGSYLWQIVFEGTKWLLGSKRPLRAGRLAAYRQVLASGLK